MPHPHRRARRVASCAAVLGTVTALTLTGVPRTAAQPMTPGGPDPDTSSAQRERKGDYDARTGSTKQQLAAARTLAARRSAAQATLRSELGVQGVQQIDPTTGTPQMVGRLDGFLTATSKQQATTIVLGYVRTHLAAFGLTEADLDTFKLRRTYTDVAGIKHLSWIQTVDGLEVFGNGLKANVTKRGELISIQGSPISGLVQQAAAAGPHPTLDAAQARQKAAADVGGQVSPAGSRTAKAGRQVRWTNDDRAQLVWFATSRGLRLGWSTYVQAGGADLNYQHVVDARSGTVLYRHDTTDSDRNTAPDPATGSSTVGPPSTSSTAAPLAATTQATAQAATHKGQALVYRNYPGARYGGKQQVYDLVLHKMVPAGATSLNGYYVNAFADLNDNNTADVGEKVAVPGSTGSKAQYPFKAFPSASSSCSSHLLCSWDPDKASSWKTNLAADVTQGFYFDSTYHDYLLHQPFGFTRAAGNFESRDGDAVQLNALDGANTAKGLPDDAHIDNANMTTPPDGIAPTMQMYLYHAPGTSNAEDSSLPTSSSFDASVILHEYTHGLSNRLVVDATGNSTLNSIQAGSMGEAWSDYYALDYLVSHKLEVDTSASGEVVEGKYVEAGQTLRTMGIDCPVGTTSSRCRAPSGAKGGYTYGKFSDVIGSPEVHASGEIWGQTLWDLRTRLGHTVTGMLTTRAMELSPNDPSFLDMRNAILQADQAVYGGRYRATIWKVFAARGMGFFAGSLGSDDTSPAQSFARPPAKGSPTATVTGQVLDGVTGLPLAHALVSITGHDSGFAGDYRGLTGTDGRYKITKVAVGTYPVVAVYGPGFEILSRRLKVTRTGGTASFRPRRDWAAAAGGGKVTSFNGPDYTSSGCGPANAIDLSQGAGWGSTTGNDDGDPTNVMTPKSVVVQLPATITLSSFAVNPSPVCGDADSSATAKYRIETSANGTTWTQAAQGTFAAADLGRLNAVTVAAPVPGVGYVRFTMLSPQVPSFATSCRTGSYGGCAYTDMTEVEVYGKR